MTNTSKIEYGDFQTPPSLAKRVCRLVAASGLRPATVIEPTCGEGAFLMAAADAFPFAKLYGYDRNPRYVEAARRRMSCDGRLRIDAVDFFSHDWDAALASFADPILVLGNPPWVTSATVGTLGGGNLPTKSNADKPPGIHAITGSANFDISEWMIRQNIRWLNGRVGTVAVLCKTSVARKVLRHAWSSRFAFKDASIHSIDAAAEFGVAVDACLLQINFDARFEHGRAKQESGQRCTVYDNLASAEPATAIRLPGRFAACRCGCLRTMVGVAQRWLRWLAFGAEARLQPRLRIASRTGWVAQQSGRGRVSGSGCRVPAAEELGCGPRSHPAQACAGAAALDERVAVDAPTASAQGVALLAGPSRSPGCARQRHLSRPPAVLHLRRGRLFLSPWKVAIAGLYKSLRFEKVAPLDGRPVLLDDTCYFLPCETEADCNALIGLLRSPPATEFYSALTFWDAKRPITAKLLNQLDLAALAKRLGKWSAGLARLLTQRGNSGFEQPDLLGVGH